MSKVGCGYRNKIPILQCAIRAYYATETVSRVTCSVRALVFTATYVEQVESLTDEYRNYHYGRSGCPSVRGLVEEVVESLWLGSGMKDR